MNRKRNVQFSRPEDPEFLKVLKKQAGYDDRNHKFDKLENAEEDFADDEESERPQVVVLKEGDLTAEEAELEQKRIEKIESETKADLSQKVLFKSKHSSTYVKNTKRKPEDSNTTTSKKKKQPLLSFDDEDEEEE